MENKIKKKLDEIILNITNIIAFNTIDENYLSNYLRNYYEKDANVEIDMNQYAEDFNTFQSNIEAINKDEPVYKNYIRQILIESFNISYSNKIKLFITNEISDTINILISDKINIFIDHFLNKLNNDFEYYYSLFKKWMN